MREIRSISVSVFRVEKCDYFLEIKLQTDSSFGLRKIWNSSLMREAKENELPDSSFRKITLR